MNRQDAIKGGFTQYNGSPCVHCGGTGRYTANSSCVDCTNQRNYLRRVTPASLEREKGRLAREAATAAGHRTYKGAPCKHCGNTERYTSNTGCVHCITQRTLDRRNKAAAAYHSDTCPVIWVMTPPAPEYAHLYAMCPSLAAYGGNIHLAYTDAHHTLPGVRIYPGCDVLKRPAPLQLILNDRTHIAYDMVMHLAPAYYPALRMFNDKVCRRV